MKMIFKAHQQKLLETNNIFLSINIRKNDEQLCKISKKTNRKKGEAEEKQQQKLSPKLF